MSSSFDRLRPRTPDARDREEAGPPVAGRDAEGKRALFSSTATAPAFGSVTIECSSCGAETVLSATTWLRAAVPSLHLPLLRKRYPSWMRCPACHRRTWVHPHIRL
jgi:uncharacterized protein with PIN domain